MRNIYERLQEINKNKFSISPTRRKWCRAHAQTNNVWSQHKLFATYCIFSSTLQIFVLPIDCGGTGLIIPLLIAVQIGSTISPGMAISAFTPAMPMLLFRYLLTVLVFLSWPSSFLPNALDQTNNSLLGIV